MQDHLSGVPLELLGCPFVSLQHHPKRVTSTRGSGLGFSMLAFDGAGVGLLPTTRDSSLDQCPSKWTSFQSNGHRNTRGPCGARHLEVFPFGSQYICVKHVLRYHWNPVQSDTVVVELDHLGIAERVVFV